LIDDNFSMIRIFLLPEELTSKEIIIHGENAHYLSSVLRVKTGEEITIFDGQGYRYICKVSEIHRKEVIVEKIKKEIYSAESPISIILAQGIPKRDKMDLIVQKSTELGVKKIIPLITERSQIRYTAKAERWRKIAASASQQSGRGKIPDVEEPVYFKSFIGTMSLRGIPRNRDDEAISENEILRSAQNDKYGGCGIIFSEEEKKQDLKKILSDLQDTKEIILLIGPEGGFSKDEISTAIQKGFISVSLGPRILRTETAAITAISIIQYELGDMG